MKKVDYDDVKRVLKTASNNRRRIMSTLNKNRREDNHELAKSRHELKNHISNLKKTQSAEMHKAKTLWQTSSTFSTGTLPLATATAPTTAGSTSTAL
jgi:Skp family chaperone for outer membrane proteins